MAAAMMQKQQAAAATTIVLLFSMICCCYVLVRNKIKSKPTTTTSVKKKEASNVPMVKYCKKVGILGGLGPAASVSFMKDIVNGRVRLFNAMKGHVVGKGDELFIMQNVRRVSKTDWTVNEITEIFSHTENREQLLDDDYIPILINLATTIPPRPKFILGESLIDPTNEMFLECVNLIRGGATHIAIVCSTAHYFLRGVQTLLASSDNHMRKVEFINMIEITLRYYLQHVRNRVTNNNHLGLLATEATFKTGIYHEYAKTHQLEIISLLDIPGIKGRMAQDELHRVIFGETGIKAGYDDISLPEAKASLLLLIKQVVLLKRHFPSLKTILLGCTELPLILNVNELEKDSDYFSKLFGGENLLDESEIKLLKDVSFIDPCRILADYVIKLTLLSRQDNV